MKFIYIFLSVIFSLQLFAQKKLIVYNLSSYKVDIGTVYTTPTTTTAYPYFTSILPANTFIHVESLGDSYTFENLTSTTRFPFKYTPVSGSGINNWYRQSTLTSGVSMTSNNAWTLFGNGQTFNCFKLKITSTNGVGQTGGTLSNYLGIGTGNIFVNGNTLTPFVFSLSEISNSNVIAYFFRNVINSTNYEDIIVVEDL